MLATKVIPKSSRTEIKGWENNELVIRLAAVPDKGEANDELIRFLSSHLKIGKSKIQIIQGQKSRHKKILIDDFSESDILQKLL